MAGGIQYFLYYFTLQIRNLILANGLFSNASSIPTPLDGFFHIIKERSNNERRCSEAIFVSYLAY